MRASANSVEAERALLGAVLTGRGAWPTWLEAGDFSLPAHRVIFAAMATLRERAVDIDMVTLSAALQGARRTKVSGGAAYLADLAESTATVVDVDAYTTVVLDGAYRRRLDTAARDMLVAIADGDAAGIAAAREAFEAVREPGDRHEPPSVAEWWDAPEPEPVLWRMDPEAGADAPIRDVLLAQGEVAVVSGPGGAGKSFVTLQLALAAAGGDPEALGFGVRPGPVLLVTYEDSPVRIARRLRAMGATREDCTDVRVLEEPGPLHICDRDGDHAGPTWRRLWGQAAAMGARLIILDPGHELIEGADEPGAGVVRSLIGALSRAADRIGAAVLLVSHDTKGARSAGGDDPGPGAVGGSRAWFDRARSVLHMVRSSDDPLLRTLRCLKANHGRSGWEVSIRERTTPSGRFAGFQFDGV